MRASGWIGWTVGAALLVGTGCEKVGQALDDLAPRPERRVRGPQPVYVDPVPATPREPPPVLEDPEILLDLGKWDAAPSAEREDAARGIDQRLTPFAFQRLQSFSAGGQKHEVAIFQHERTALEFVLIPRGRSRWARLGQRTAARATRPRGGSR